MRADFHIHTQYSCDADANIEDYVKQAIQSGMDMICFTDHVESE